MENGRCADRGRRWGVVDQCAGYGNYSRVFYVELSESYVGGTFKRASKDLFCMNLIERLSVSMLYDMARNSDNPLNLFFHDGISLQSTVALIEMF